MYTAAPPAVTEKSAGSLPADKASLDATTRRVRQLKSSCRTLAAI
jgi:hypothetical protein